MDPSGHYADPFGEALSHSSQRVTQLTSLVAAAAEVWGAPSLPDCGPPVRSIRKGLGVNGRQEKELHA